MCVCALCVGFCLLFVGDKLFEFAFIMPNELVGSKKVANDMAKMATGKLAAATEAQ